VLLAFAKLGVSCLGGPIAHIGYFREEFAVRRRWLDEPAFADLAPSANSSPAPPAAKLGFRLA
jgi:chromate transporter